MDGAHTVYAYDASGQRVLQATVVSGTHAGTAVAYTPAGQVEDADTSATTVGDVTGTRYYTFGGATVAVRTHDGNLALVLGDEQGSVSVTMPVTLNPDGTMASAPESAAISFAVSAPSNLSRKQVARGSAEPGELFQELAVLELNQAIELIAPKIRGQ